MADVPGGVGHLRGGILSLYRLLREHGEAIRADLLRDGLRLADLSWLDLRALVRYPRPGSALERALDPDAWVTPDVQFLRSIEHRLSWLVWAQTEDAAKGFPPPSPRPLTVAEREAVSADRADALPAEEMYERLYGRRTKEGEEGGDDE